MRGRSAVILVALVAGACSSKASTPQAGTERGPCYGNETCNEGLMCLSDTCVKPPEPRVVSPAKATPSVESAVRPTTETDQSSDDRVDCTKNPTHVDCIDEDDKAAQEYDRALEEREAEGPDPKYCWDECENDDENSPCMKECMSKL